MIMYIIDIGTIKERLPDEDAAKAELIFLHRDLLRGYTLSPLTMKIYYEQIEKIVGKYVVIEVFEKPVPDNLSETKYDEIARDFYTKLVEDAMVGYGTFCERLCIYDLDNGGEVVATSSIIESSTEVFDYADMLYVYIILFDEIFKYTKLQHDENFNKLRNFVIGDYPLKIDDFFSTSGRWQVDPYVIFKYYLEKLMWI